MPEDVKSANDDLLKVLKIIEDAEKQLLEIINKEKAKFDAAHSTPREVQKVKDWEEALCSAIDNLTDARSDINDAICISQTK